jgi:hypothetical protein
MVVRMIAKYISKQSIRIRAKCVFVRIRAKYVVVRIRANKLWLLG